MIGTQVSFAAPCLAMPPTATGNMLLLIISTENRHPLQASAQQNTICAKYMQTFA